MRILNIEPGYYPDELRRLLSSAGQVDYAECANQAAFRALVGRAPYDALIITLGVSIDAELLDAAPAVRWIVSPATGVEHIDLGAAEARGIAVLTLRGESAFLEGVLSTAEHTWALLLSLVRNIPSAVGDVRSGRWRRHDFLCSELSGKTLGVIGHGRLGRAVARYGVAFGMRVWVYDQVPFDAAAAGPGIEPKELDDLLRDADVVSLHLPLNSETQGFLSSRRIATMKRGALVVNTARGEVIDEDALLSALEQGHLGGASLDVLSGESLFDRSVPGTNRLVAYAATHDNLIITPHIGGYAKEAIEKTRAFMVRRFLEAVAETVTR